VAQNSLRTARTGLGTVDELTARRQGERSRRRRTVAWVMAGGRGLQWALATTIAADNELSAD